MRGPGRTGGGGSLVPAMDGERPNGRVNEERCGQRARMVGSGGAPVPEEVAVEERQAG